MRTADFAILMEIAEDGEKSWDKKFYRKQGMPTGSLKRLAEEGFVEVETRSCSPWSYGPAPMEWSQWVLLPETQKAYESMVIEEWRNERTLRSRSEVYAKITPRGLAFLRTLT